MLSNYKRDRRKCTFDIIEFLLCVILLCAFAYEAYVLFTKWNPYLINSDSIYSITFREATWEQKTLFPEGLMSPNEQVASQPILIYWLFYALTKNGMLSYRLEDLSVLLLQLASVGILLKKLRLKRKTVLFGMTMYLAWLLGHINSDVLFWGQDAYAMHALIVFITLILRITLYEDRGENAKLRKGKRLTIIAGMVALSALHGFTSIRMAMVLYVPLLFADGVKLFFLYTNDRAIPRREISTAILDAILVLVNITFYGIGLALYGDKFYPPTVSITPISTWLSWPVISSQLEALIIALGLRGAGEIGSIDGISFFLSGFVMVIQIYAIFWLILKRRNEENREINDIIGYWLAATAIVFCLEYFCSSTGVSVSRHFFVTSILPPVICAYALERWSRRAKRFNLPAVMGTASCAALLLVTMLCKHALFTTEPPVLTQAASYMQENGYQYVVASYWNARVIEGYTEGEIDSLHGTVSTMEPYNWLIDTRKFDQERIGEPGILLLTDEEEAAVDPYVAYMLQNDAQKVQEIGEYNLYAVQENPFTLISKIHKSGAGLPIDEDFKAVKPSAPGFVYHDAEIAENGDLVSKGNESTCVLFGPYTESIPGIYDITLHYKIESYQGENTGLFDIALDTVQQRTIEIDPQKTEAVLKGVNIDAGHLFEARVWVPQGMIIRVQSIEYSKID